MGEHFYLLPKGTLIMKLPRVYPLMLKITTLAAVMLCGIYISSICLKQTLINMKPDSATAKPSYDPKLLGFKRTEIRIQAELTREKPFEDNAYDPPVVGLKQTEIQMTSELPMTRPLGHSSNPIIVTSEHSNDSNAKPMEEHSNDPRIVSMKQLVTSTKPELVRSKPMEDHSFDSEVVDMNQTDTRTTSDMESTGSSDRIITLKQRKIQIKPEQTTIRPTEQHSYNPQAVSLKQTKMLVKPELKQTKSKDKQSFDPRIVGEKQTVVQQKPESVKSEPTQMHCQDPGIPQSEIPYVHYPVPTNYSRGRCACTPVRFYVIVSVQRSGSKWLESLLNSHGNISSNGEIFFDRERSANMLAITQTLDMVYNLDWKHAASRRRCTAAVGFKWMLNQGILENHEEISKYFKRRGVSVIFLFRRNLLRRMVSLIANLRDNTLLNGTHKAHVVTQQEANILASYKPKLNARLLVSKLKLAATKAAAAKERFKSMRHIDLYYENLVQNNTQKLAEVMDFLRVPQERLSSDHVKIHTKPLSEMIGNWNAVRRALKGSQFASFLTSE